MPKFWLVVPERTKGFEPAQDRRTPPSLKCVTTRLWFSNIGYSTTTAQWLNTSDLVGFSGPTPVRVPLSSTKWRNSIYICIRAYIHVCVYIYIYLYAKTYAQIYTHIIRIQRFRMLKYIWAPLGKKVARPVAGQNFHPKINIFKDSFKLLGL